MRTSEAMTLIISQVQETKITGLIRLEEWGCVKLCNKFATEYDPFKVTSSLLKCICDKINVYIMKGKNLEMLRRIRCNFRVINNCFSMFETILHNIDPKYLFNADETGLATNKKL